MKLAIAGLRLLSLGLAWPLPAWAQQAPPVRYDLSFENAVHHEARITVTYRDMGRAPVRFEMSRSSPGRYALHEFAKNVYSVSAVDGAGRPLTVERTDPYGWTVGGPRRDGQRHLHPVRRPGRRHLRPDRRHPRPPEHARDPDVGARLRRPSGHLTFHSPTRLAVATQLAPTARPDVFTAPNLQYLMDSPTELSDHMVREWQVDDAGVPRTIRIALHHPARRAGRHLRRTRPQGGGPADRRLRRRARLRLRDLHLPGRLPAPGQRRRDGAPQLDGHQRHPLVRRRRLRPDRHPEPRVLPLVERRAAASRRTGAVRLHPRQRHAVAVVRRGLHQLLRAAGHPPRGRVDGRRFLGRDGRPAQRSF
jgi:hypothetical protein